ncbi:hypothetical protein Tco_1195355 [Tanacetum coccineum]
MWNKNRQRVLVSKRIKRSDELKNRKRALVDGKKVIITESTIRRDLHLEDVEGVDCLPNATIFEQLTLMGYEKLSQKLTFYKAFFSPQWKFLIHTILQCLSAKTTAWNEFSSTMTYAIICLAINQKFNFSKYIFESMVKNLDSVGKFLMIESSEDKGLGEEDASKQGRIDDIDANEDIYLVNVHKDEDMFGLNDLEAQELTALKSAKPKADKVMLQEPEQGTITTTAATTVIAARTRPKAKWLVTVQDKGKSIMEEPEKPTKRKDQIRHDEEVTQRLQAQMQAKLEEEDRLVRQREEEANIVSWDNVQAMIDADYQMA